MPLILPVAILPYCLIILRMSEYWWRTWFTSWTVVPLPRAMRLRRLPSIRLWSERSAAVMELMMASTEREALFVDLGILGNFGEGADFGQHSQQGFERTHFAKLAQLVAEILESEIVLAKLAFEFAGLFFVDVLLGFFDQG